MAKQQAFIDLTGQVAVVTGAGSGIGRGIALELAAAGAAVVVADINPEAAQQVATEIESAGRQSLAVTADVTSQDSTDGMVTASLGHFGHVDILVNNAGIGGAPGWTGRSVPTPEDWDAVFAVNVLGIVHSCQSVAAHMTGRRSGKIVNIASAAGRQGSPGFAHYSASKASAINVTQAWAYKLAPFNINVNSVCPGLLWTDLWEEIAARNLATDGDSKTTGREYFERRVAAGVPLGREQTPEDIGKAVAFLASGRAGNITGQALNVDGGTRMN